MLPETLVIVGIFQKERKKNLQSDMVFLNILKFVLFFFLKFFLVFHFLIVERHRDR